MKSVSRIVLISVILSIVIVIAGCVAMNRQAPGASQAGADPALTLEQATAIAENALAGFKDGNYTVWSRDWTDAMKGGIKEKDFLSFREQVIANFGEYQSIASIEKTQGQNKGYIRWSVIANFEKGQIRFDFAFKEDGKLIEGVFPEPLSS
jgi:hypothetical protein